VPEPLLVADGVGKRFSRGLGDPGTDALSEVSLQLHQGECLGVVGESGSGKTTLARILAGLLDVTEGTVSFRDTPLDTRRLRRDRELRRQIQIVFQNPVTALNPRRTVEQALRVPLSNFYGMSGRLADERIRGLLDSVELGQRFLKRYPHEMSGGQCQRVAVARALAAEPTILVLDESVASVDALTAMRLLELFSQLREERGLTYVFITHDLGIVEDFSDRLIVLRHGRLVEEGRTADVCAAPSHEYTQELFAASDSVVFDIETA
jgi:ABC-type glutathione transport system ATPase component